jgi:hypothetical protein
MAGDLACPVAPERNGTAILITNWGRFFQTCFDMPFAFYFVSVGNGFANGTVVGKFG